MSQTAKKEIPQSARKQMRYRASSRLFRLEEKEEKTNRLM